MAWNESDWYFSSWLNFGKWTRAVSDLKIIDGHQKLRQNSLELSPQTDQAADSAPRAWRRRDNASPQTTSPARLAARAWNSSSIFAAYCYNCSMTLKMVTMATSVLSCRSCPHCWNWCCHLSYRFLHSRMIHVDLYHNSIKDEIEYEKFDNIININQTRSQEVQKWRLLAVNLDWRDRLFLSLSCDKLKMKSQVHIPHRKVQQFLLFAHVRLQQSFDPPTCSLTPPQPANNNSKLDKNLLFNFVWFCYVLWVFSSWVNIHSCRRLCHFAPSEKGKKLYNFQLSPVTELLLCLWGWETAKLIFIAIL